MHVIVYGSSRKIAPEDETVLSKDCLLAMKNIKEGNKRWQVGMLRQMI